MAFPASHLLKRQPQELIAGIVPEGDMACFVYSKNGIGCILKKTIKNT
jgi:hypothetical protein